MITAKRVNGAVHLIHTRIQQCHDSPTGLFSQGCKTGVFSHSQQRVHRQQGHINTKPQTLRHRAGSAQAGKRAWPGTKTNSVKVRHVQLGLFHQVEHRGNQTRRRLSAACALKQPLLRHAAHQPLHAD